MGGNVGVLELTPCARNGDSLRRLLQCLALCQHQLNRLGPKLWRIVCCSYDFIPFDKFIKSECPRMSGYLKVFAVGMATGYFSFFPKHIDRTLVVHPADMMRSIPSGLFG